MLERDRDCDPDAWVHAVIYVVPVVGVIDINVVGFVPVRSPRFRPRINERNPIAVVLEARISADEEHGKAVDAEEVLTPEVEPEAVIRNSVAVVAAALLPGTVFAIPRTGARLDETAAHLPLVLWDSAMVDAANGGAGGLDAAMIGAAEALLRSLRRFISRLRTLLLCGFRLLLLCGSRLLLLCGSRLLLLCGFRLLLLCGFRLLMLLPLLRFALLLFLWLALCVGRNNASEKKEKNSGTDKTNWFHECCLHYGDFMRPSPAGAERSPAFLRDTLAPQMPTCKRHFAS